MPKWLASENELSSSTRTGRLCHIYIYLDLLSSAREGLGNIVLHPWQLKSRHRQMWPVRTVALCHGTTQQNMAVNACKRLQMFLFSHKMWLCLTSSRCRHLGLVECSQGVTKLQLVLYTLFGAIWHVYLWNACDFVMRVMDVFIEKLPSLDYFFWESTENKLRRDGN